MNFIRIEKLSPSSVLRGGNGQLWGEGRGRLSATLLSVGLCGTLPEVMFVGCNLVSGQQDSRKTRKRVSAPLFATMFPPPKEKDLPLGLQDT